MNICYNISFFIKKSIVKIYAINIQQGKMYVCFADEYVHSYLID